MLAVYQQRAMSQQAMPHSDLGSGSDDSQEDSGGFALELQFVAELGEAFSMSRYSIRKMKGLVKNLYQNRELALRIKHHCLELRAKDKAEINWEKVFTEFTKLIEEQYALSPEARLSEEGLKVAITKLITANSDVLSTQQAFEEEKMKS